MENGLRLVCQNAYYAELEEAKKNKNFGNAVFAQPSKLFCVLDAPRRLVDHFLDVFSLLIIFYQE